LGRKAKGKSTNKSNKMEPTTIGGFCRGFIIVRRLSATTKPVLLAAVCTQIMTDSLNEQQQKKSNEGRNKSERERERMKNRSIRLFVLVVLFVVVVFFFSPSSLPALGLMKKLSKKPPFKGGVGGRRWPQLIQKNKSKHFNFSPQ
jgi:predicted nucleic acid-binding Zn ribbon protein